MRVKHTVTYRGCYSGHRGGDLNTTFVYSTSLLVLPVLLDVCVLKVIYCVIVVVLILRHLTCLLAIVRLLACFSSKVTIMLE